MSHTRGVHFLGEALSDLFFPRSCPFCDSAEPSGGPSSLCESCRSSIRDVTPPLCDSCGLPVPGVAATAGICGRCLTTPPFYRRARYAARYEGKLREAILRFKFGGALYIGRALSNILIEEFERRYQAAEFDLIIPVPIHSRRLRQRGFNQSIILGEGLAAHTGIRLDRRALQKSEDSTPQVGLPRSLRLKNLKGSFAVRRRDAVRDRRILLVDDIATTGATINEAARTLVKAGAASVDVLVTALTVPYAPDESPPGAEPQE